MTLEAAVLAMDEGVRQMKADARPFETVDLGAIKVSRDAERSSKARTERITVFGAKPGEALEAIRRYSPKGSWSLSAIEPLGANHAETIAAYKAGGYRFAVRLPLYAIDLRPGWTRSPNVRCVSSTDDAAMVAKAAGRFLPGLKAWGDPDDSIRIYGAFEDNQPLGWVQSVRGGDEVRWVANLYVQPKARRQGLGTALMNTMLADDYERGYRGSVLTASSDGAKLYERLGYDQVGVVLLFTPIRDVAIKRPRVRAAG